MMLKIAAVCLLFSIGHAKENYKYAKEIESNNYKSAAHQQYQYQTTQSTQYGDDSHKYEAPKYESNKNYEATGEHYYKQQDGGDRYEHHAETYENAYPKYEFNYEVHNEKTGDIKSQEEQRDGHNVQGKYSLIDADGFRRTVEYKSEGKTGFKATVLREPLAGFKSPHQEYVKYTTSKIKTYDTDYHTTESAPVHKYTSAENYKKPSLTPEEKYFLKYSAGAPEIKYVPVPESKDESDNNSDKSYDKYELNYDYSTQKTFKPSAEYVPKKYGYEY